MLEDRIKSLPIWNVPISIAPLHGGLSNESYLVTDKTGKYVVRFGIDYPFHHVLRDREVMTAKAAFEAGFAPEVVYSQPGCMVSRFIEGRTWTAADVVAAPELIGGLLRSFHTEMPARVSGPAYLFWPFHVIRDYGRILREHHSNWWHSVKDYVVAADWRLETAQVPLPIIFGHHDLLPANFLHDGKKLLLIDFEYAGFGTAMFDLASVAANSSMDDEQAERLLTAYFGARSDIPLQKAFRAMLCAALLREAMWSLVSSLFLTTPGVDFEAYARENLNRLDAAFIKFNQTK